MKMGPERNDLLFLLPQQAKERLFPLLREIELPGGMEIHGAGLKEGFVYFPADCIIGHVHATCDGHTSEISVVGREGVVGLSVLMCAGSTPNRAVVVSAGTAYRLPANAIKREFENDPAIRKLMLRYTQALFTQMAQTALCNRHHKIGQQLCRWLLLSLDRLPTNELTVTQELIANMLGVRREGVTEAAGKLQKLGAISYRRGHITVLDRPRLEALSCECYSVVREETNRLVA
ncbi:Crp/Fnr family transcriptional regulator [Wenzhouxiangella sp. EGI_FJ10305]|uniref:Crp/Fnr family transcriptional regulator n=1 Tax=Wenzhouxiangella sp. EGI_FJ10305 TaxID=3243768 RepID=UPI0035DBD35F